MNGKVAKAIRNNMYYPRKRLYRKDERGTIHADSARKEYQQKKKDYMLKKSLTGII